MIGTLIINMTGGTVLYMYCFHMNFNNNNKYNEFRHVIIATVAITQQPGNRLRCRHSHQELLDTIHFQVLVVTDEHM